MTLFQSIVDYLNDFVEKKKKQYDRELQILEEQEAAAVEPIMSSASLTEVTSTTSVIEMKDSNNIEIKIEEKAAEVPPKRKANWKSKLSSLLVKFRRSFLLMLSMTIHNLPGMYSILSKHNNFQKRVLLSELHSDLFQTKQIRMVFQFQMLSV